MTSEKVKLLNEIGAKIEALNLLMSALKSDHSRTPKAVKNYRKQYLELLKEK